MGYTVYVHLRMMTSVTAVPIVIIGIFLEGWLYVSVFVSLKYDQNWGWRGSRLV